MKETIDLLRKSAVQFRYYAQQHLDKCPALERQLHGTKSRVDVAADQSVNAVREQLAATRKKHEVNLRLAEQIEEHLLKIEGWAMEPSEPYMPKPITE